jgi:hypothetical protein
LGEQADPTEGVIDKIGGVVLALRQLGVRRLPKLGVARESLSDELREGVGTCLVTAHV